MRADHRDQTPAGARPDGRLGTVVVLGHDEADRRGSDGKTYAGRVAREGPGISVDTVGKI